MVRTLALCALLLFTSGCAGNQDQSGGLAPAKSETTTQLQDQVGGQTTGKESQAAEYAKRLLGSNQVGKPSRNGLVSHVRAGGFTQTEAEAGVDSLGIDWSRMAADLAKQKVGAYPYRLDLLDSLLRSGFTQAEAESGLALIGCVQMRCDAG